MRGWRWWVGRAGRVLIATGILVLLFAAYQLWGTGIQTALAQNDLSSEFDKALAATTTATPATTSPPTSSSATTSPPTTAAPAVTAPPAPAQGDPVARLELPRIGVDQIVVQGVDVTDLRKGPGHYPSTPLPGVRGNVGIAGHRTTYGAPFEDIDDLEPGDEVILTTVTGRYVYRVTTTAIVSPSETNVLADTPEAVVTLTSCHPKYSARERIIVSAAFDQAASSPLLEPVPVAPPPTPPATTTPETLPGATAVPASTTVSDDPVVTTAAVEETFGQGWVSDPDAWWHLAAWGTLLSAIGIGAWLLGKRIPQWSAALLAIVPFLVVLYFFFDNVNRLLPPNL